MRGGRKQAAPEEAVTIDFAFASVVTICDVKENELFTEQNIWVKRPGTGEILAEHYESIIGKRASRAIVADEQLRWDDIAND